MEERSTSHVVIHGLGSLPAQKPDEACHRTTVTMKTVTTMMTILMTTKAWENELKTTFPAFGVASIGTFLQTVD